MFRELIYDVHYITHIGSRVSIHFWMEKSSIHNFEKKNRKYQWIELQKNQFIVVHYWQQINFNVFCKCIFWNLKPHHISIIWTSSRYIVQLQHHILYQSICYYIAKLQLQAPRSFLIYYALYFPYIPS